MTRFRSGQELFFILLFILLFLLVGAAVFKTVRLCRFKSNRDEYLAGIFFE